MDLLQTDVIKAFVRCCDDGWQQGWHERNGGNLTYRMTDIEVAECKPGFVYDKEWTKLGVTAENLAGEYFIATGSGKYLRNVSLAPQDNICIIEINDAGDSGRIVWGLEKGGKPTSEFPSHYLNHSVKKAVSDGTHRVIYHAHVPYVIALTYVLPVGAKEFTRILWSSATECPVVFPEGVGQVPWMVPGGPEIAHATSEEMKRFNAVIWTHHGLFCSGTDFDDAFGLMHTIEKAAEIYVKALSTGLEFKQTITDENLREIAVAFGVTLNEEFLN